MRSCGHFVWELCWLVRHSFTRAPRARGLLLAQQPLLQMVQLHPASIIWECHACGLQSLLPSLPQVLPSSKSTNHNPLLQWFLTMPWLLTCKCVLWVFGVTSKLGAVHRPAGG